MREKTQDQKVSSLINKTLKLLNKTPLTVSELIIFYGNLGYHIGSSLCGFKGKGPTIEEIKREYYANPTVDTGLMLQGLLITSWEEDFLKQPRLSRWAKENKKEGK